MVAMKGSKTFAEVSGMLPESFREEMKDRVSLIQEKNPDHALSDIQQAVADEYFDLAFPPI